MATAAPSIKMRTYWMHHCYKWCIPGKWYLRQWLDTVDTCVFRIRSLKTDAIKWRTCGGNCAYRRTKPCWYLTHDKCFAKKNDWIVELPDWSIANMAWQFALYCWASAPPIYWYRSCALPVITVQNCACAETVPKIIHQMPSKRNEMALWRYQTLFGFLLWEGLG